MSEKAIIKYINLCSQNKIETIQDLSSGQIFCEIASHIQPSKIDLSKVLEADDWIPKLSNLKLFLKHLQQYNEEQLGHKLQTHDLDLLKIAKHQQKDQIIKLFEILLGVMMNCSNKQNFINLILKMDQNSQHQLTDIVKKVMVQPQGDQIIHNSNESSTLLQKLDQLQHQLYNVKKQNSRLKDSINERQNQNKILHNQISKLTKTINNLNHEIQERQSKSHSNEIFDNNSLVESLKQKLIIQSVEHQKQKMRMNEQIDLMRVKLDRIDIIESKSEQYQYKIKELNQKISDLQDDLVHSNEELAMKRQTMRRLQERYKVLSEKIQKEELEKISLQVDVQKLNVRNSRNDELKKNSTIQSRVSDTYIEQYSKQRQSQQQLSIANRRIKTLQKQLARANLKADKSTKLQNDKKQLQQTLIIQLNTKKQQIQLLASALIEIRLQHLNLVNQK